MKVRDKMIIFCLAIAAGLFLFLLYRYIGSRTLGLTFPWNSFLFLENARYTDFFEINELVANLNPYKSGSSYPPLALLVALLFAKIIPGTGSIGADPASIQAFRDVSVAGKTALYLFYAGVLLAIASIFWKRIYTYNKNHPGEFVAEKTRFTRIRDFFDRFLAYPAILAAVALSAPVIYAFDRGNYLVLCVLFLVLFASFYGRNDWLAAIFLAIAACLKIYPVVLFFVFLVGRKWKPMFLGLSVGALITGLGMAVFKGNYIRNTGYFLKNVFNFSGGFGDNHSFYYRYATGFRNLIATPVLAVSDKIPEEFPISRLTLILSGVFLLLVIAICFLDKRPWRQILCLSFFMILFPTPSFFYNLSYLVAPILLFLFKEEREKYDRLYLAGLILLMIPKSYYYFMVTYTDAPGYTGIECFLNPAIMCFLIVLSFVDAIAYRRRLRASKLAHKNVDASAVSQQDMEEVTAIG